MNNNYEITIPENLQPEDAAEQLPIVISESMGSLKAIQQKIHETQRKAKDAKEKAVTAWHVKVGFFHRTTPALEALQSAGKCQSEALIDLSECQELLFKQQYILAQCTRLLFMLCCANIANARIAVKEIQMRLQEASQEEISEMARNELQKTVQQLKQQIDLLEQHDRLKRKVENIDLKMKKLEECIANSTGIEIKMPIQAPDADQILPEKDIKNRKIFYTLFAVIFGWLGAHDFYAGKIFCGIAKICITLISAGTLFWISTIWAIIDIVMAYRDKDFFTVKWHVIKQTDVK